MRGVCYHAGVEAIAERLETVRQRVGEACARAGRAADEVVIMAVTKTQPETTVRAAYEAGIRCFGENRVQEAVAKYAGSLCELPGLDLQMLGHVQRNKAREVAELFSTVQSIDAVRTLNALQQACERFSTRLDILMEINTSGDENKFGFTSQTELYQCVERALESDRLCLRGLMTIGPFTDNRDRIRGAFRSLAESFHAVRDRYGPPTFDVLSMGMSGDYEIAVEEGSTMLRLGTVLFGEREPAA